MVSTVLLIYCCLFWYGSNGGWTQAADNSSVSRRQSLSLHLRIGSIDGVERNSLPLPKPILESTESSPCATPVLSPISAPTAAPFSLGDTQSDRDEHNAWLLQQQQYALEQQYPASSSQFSSVTPAKSERKSNGLLPSFLSTASFAEASKSVLDASKAYSQKVHKESPTTFWTAFSSIVIFLCWNLVPALHSILMQFCLASRRSAKKTMGLSLVLSSVSHNSFRHLLFNLLAFLSLSPALRSIKVPAGSWAATTRSSKYVGLSTTNLWTFFLGGALSGNLLFLLFRANGSCLGLSGVICAMMGAYGCAAPERVMRIRIYGILPVSLKMKRLVQALLVVSLAGAIFQPSSPISHLGHLGGLLFGILYYQSTMTNRRIRKGILH